MNFAKNVLIVCIVLGQIFAKMRALVFWLLEKRTSIVDIECLFEEDRHPGRIAQVLWGKERHPAQVIKIASKSVLFNCFMKRGGRIIGLLEMFIVHSLWCERDVSTIVLLT